MKERVIGKKKKCWRGKNYEKYEKCDMRKVCSRRKKGSER